MRLTAIAAAQKARWTKIRKTAKVVLIRGKRTLLARCAKEDRRCTKSAMGTGEGGKKTA
jgi:hypothetical protein